MLLHNSSDFLSTKSDPAHGVETTPQTWISGYDTLREYFGEEIKGGVKPTTNQSLPYS